MRDTRPLLASLALFLFAPMLRAQSAPPAVPAAAVVSLPIRQIALYKNGVGYFQLSGKVAGNALIRLDFSTAQLNDVLQSLTAVDLGGGHIAGLGYGGSQTIAQQLDQMHLGLGPDPTVLEFLNALKGTPVEIKTGAQTVSGKLLNVEDKPATSAKTSETSERRFVSVISANGTLRTAELTPSTEIHMLDGDQRREIGRYLSLLATTHNPEVRHVTLEAIGAGEREIQISYISALPAWKSSYRVLMNDGAKTATLQGFAIIDNTSADDWQDVQLTLVSGAPKSFLQQISRPNDIVRPEIGMDGGVIRRFPDPIAGIPSSSVEFNATSIGGGAGVQLSPVKIPVEPVLASASDYEEEARKSLAPDASANPLDDLFEYKLAKPMTIRHNQSFVLPILQTTLNAEQVSLWLSRQPNKGVQRALWLTNTSKLTLDEGSFTIIEDGVYGGQGQVPLLHPGQVSVAAYASDDSVKVGVRQVRDLPAIVHRINIQDGTLTVHRWLHMERDFTIRNAGPAPRTVVLGVLQSPPAPHVGAWKLMNETPAADISLSEPKGELYRFKLQVAGNATRVFQVVEHHSHPTHQTLAEMNAHDIEGVIHESHDNPDLIAQLQPILDARHKLAGLDAQLKEQQKGIDEANAEEARLRQNIATLKGSSEEKPLAKRYTDAMNAQEDKLSTLQTQRAAARQLRDATQNTLADHMHTLKSDLKFPRNSADYEWLEEVRKTNMGSLDLPQ